MDQTATRLGREPKVSINMSTYNRAGFLSSAIESVLKQTFTDWELIIVDDASTDQTQEVLSPYLGDPRIHYLKNDTNQGIGRTRNSALTASVGQYLAILDSDDLWLDPDKLKQQVEFLDRHQDYNLVGTGVVEINQDNQELKRYFLPESDQKIRETILSKNPFAHSGVLYRRPVALEVGSYPLNLDGIEDYDLWLRLGRRGKFHNLPLHALAYRRHPGNISQTDRLRLMTANLVLVKKYRADYPRFYRAWSRRFGRLNLARLLTSLRINF